MLTLEEYYAILDGFYNRVRNSRLPFHPRSLRGLQMILERCVATKIGCVSGADHFPPPYLSNNWLSLQVLILAMITVLHLSAFQLPPFKSSLVHIWETLWDQGFLSNVTQHEVRGRPQNKASHMLCLHRNAWCLCTRRVFHLGKAKLLFPIAPKVIYTGYHLSDRNVALLEIFLIIYSMIQRVFKYLGVMQLFAYKFCVYCSPKTTKGRLKNRHSAF